MNPVAVITGGGTGIGASTARRLAQDGAAEIRAAYPVRARALVMDVTDRESVRAAAEQIGDIDVLVNNAGGAIGAERVEDGKPEEWRAMWESNVLGVLHVTQEFLPALRR